MERNSGKKIYSAFVKNPFIYWMDIVRQKLYKSNGLLTFAPQVLKRDVLVLLTSTVISYGKSSVPFPIKSLPDRLQLFSWSVEKMSDIESSEDMLSRNFIFPSPRHICLAVERKEKIFENEISC